MLQAAVLWILLAALLCAQEKSHPTVSASVAMTMEEVESDFLGAVEAMPEAKFAFVPKGGAFEGARSFGEQAKHAACAQIAFFAEIEGKTSIPEHCEKGGPSKAGTKAEIVAYLRKSFDYGNRVLASIDPDPLAVVTGPYGGTRTKLGMAALAVWHLSDHYGQIVMYLRLNGIVPPSTKAYPLSVR